MTQVEIAALPVSEKLQLMESLWDAICRETSDSPKIPDWHQEVLEARLARLDSGEETVTPWEEAKKHIRQKAEKQ